MSAAPEPAATPRPRARSRANRIEIQPGGDRAAWALDLAILAAFLGLTFLLGIFPLNDTDFWWHLRTGESMLDGSPPPQVDPYLYGRPGGTAATGNPQASPLPWIDLHWGFEVVIAWLYRRGGIVLLNLAKCVVTTLAVALLITARRREWPIAVMALAWLPALFVLGGRMYVRPETLSLLYLAIDLAILFRWKQQPRLAWLLPVVQVLWVNTQGLFVFGPVLIGMAVVDAALDRGAFGPERRGWWRTIVPAVALVGLACFVNPYGWRGAFFPLELFFGTMNNPIFAESIAELQSLSSFLAQNGAGSLPIRLLLGTMLLGALSFLIPIVWRVLARITTRVPRNELESESASKGKGSRALPDGSKTPRRSKKAEAAAAQARQASDFGWRLSPFRVLLYLAFTWMAWKASRNSHQFAAVVGTVTAWNLGEWAAALIRRREAGADPAAASARGFAGRLATLGVLGLALAWVGSGLYFQHSGEGRTLALGEKPLWFPHQAVKFAGGPGMPDRFVCFHNGLAGLFVYYNSPKQTVYADARLEVVGPELYGAYRKIGEMIALDQGDWRAELRRQGHPGIVADLIQNGSENTVATLLADPGHVCVWFDAMAAVFVPRSAPAAREPVDFRARHFAPALETSPRGVEALSATARALRNLAATILRRGGGGPGGSRPISPTLARPLILLGHGYAHQALRLDPTSAEAWKLLGQLELLRDPVAPEVSASRLGRPFDPLFDLSQARATFGLKQACALRPDDFPSQVSLLGLYQNRRLLEPAVAVLVQIGRLSPINRLQEQTQTQAVQGLPAIQQRLGAEPPGTWRNLGELERTVAQLLDRGRVASAADLLERAYEPRERGWDVADRLAALRLHLGEPERARAIWQSATSVPRPALQAARIAITQLIEEDYDAARQGFAQALAIEPDLFEAHYGLAVTEIDAGQKAAALTAATSAERTAPTDAARIAARQLLGLIGTEASAGVPVSR